jgi:hypothetical protein
MIRSPQGFAAALAVTLFACDSQLAPGYEGEALLKLSGTVSSVDPIPDRTLAELEWELEWIDFVAPEFDSAVSALGSEGEFPNRFSLEVHSRPPDRLLNDFTEGGRFLAETRIGMALIQSSNWFSYARQVLIYAEGSVRPETLSGTFTGGGLAPGFHILQVVDAPCDSYLPDDDPLEGHIDCLSPTRNDLDTIIDLRLVPLDQAEFPPEYPRLFKSSCNRPSDPCDD